jgi:hypothetical protein
MEREKHDKHDKHDRRTDRSSTKSDHPAKSSRHPTPNDQGFKRPEPIGRDLASSKPSRSSQPVGKRKASADGTLADDEDENEDDDALLNALLM